MKFFFLAFFFCLLYKIALPQNADPQISIQGTVIDSADNKPMGFVTVALQNAKTHAGVKSGLTKDDGTFLLRAPSGGPYQVVFVFVGYQRRPYR